jgi:hypothetical protein
LSGLCSGGLGSSGFLAGSFGEGCRVKERRPGI